MPYISYSHRTDVERNLDAFRLVADMDRTPGNLNYAISQILDAYISRSGVSYNVLNEVVGVLECLKLEVYRRIAAPYEDKKKGENGDVFLCAQGL